MNAFSCDIQGLNIVRDLNTSIPVKPTFIYTSPKSTTTVSFTSRVYHQVNVIMTVYNCSISKRACLKYLADIEASKGLQDIQFTRSLSSSYKLIILSVFPLPAQSSDLNVSHDLVNSLLSNSGVTSHDDYFRSDYCLQQQ